MSDESFLSGDIGMSTYLESLVANLRVRKATD
jgi:hypothetical protein